MTISFNKACIPDKTRDYINQVLAGDHHSGNGPFTKWCQSWLEKKMAVGKALLTASGTSALEMAVLLIDLKPGDEVIMPSYTFPSTANAVVLRGGIPVFVDIKGDTCSINEQLIESAITEKTKAIIAVHYAGVVSDMEAIMKIAAENNLVVIEDAAQAIMSTYNGRYAGSLGHLAAFSFHETKNIGCGEGGALLVNDKQFTERAEIIWEKGTNRSQFYRGEVDKYQWIDVGSSYLPGELTSACLRAQLEDADQITSQRLAMWQRYHDAMEAGEKQGFFRRPVIPEGSGHNGHLYYLILPDHQKREALRKYLNQVNIEAVFHYVPLHLAPAGQKFGRVGTTMEVTEHIYESLLRLPLWCGMDEVIEDVVKAVYDGVKA